LEVIKQVRYVQQAKYIIHTIVIQGFFVRAVALMDAHAEWA
jgi:hypothetical protein